MGVGDYLANPSTGALYVAQVGATYEITMRFNGATDTWQALFTGPGLGPAGVQVAVPTIQDDETGYVFDGGNILQVGGEVNHDQNDMGVAAHLDTRFETSNGTTGVMQGRTDVIKRGTTINNEMRYRIAESGNFYQVASNIHIDKVPTPVATQDVCATGW